MGQFRQLYRAKITSAFQFYSTSIGGSAKAVSPLKKKKNFFLKIDWKKVLSNATNLEQDTQTHHCCLKLAVTSHFKAVDILEMDCYSINCFPRIILGSFFNFTSAHLPYNVVRRKAGSCSHRPAFPLHIQ